MRERCVPWHKGATRLRGRLGCLIQSGSECSNDRLDLAHMPSRGEGRTFEPRGPGPPAGRGRGHGSGASSASPTAPTAPPSLPLNSPKNQILSKILPPEKFSNHWKHFFQSLENLRRADGPADCAKHGGVSVFRQDLQVFQDFGRPSSSGRPKTDHAAQELTTPDPPASRQHPENALFPPVSAVGTERAVVMADRQRRTK